VSTSSQDAQLQFDALVAAGVQNGVGAERDESASGSCPDVRRCRVQDVAELADIHGTGRRAVRRVAQAAHVAFLPVHLQLSETLKTNASRRP